MDIDFSKVQPGDIITAKFKSNVINVLGSPDSPIIETDFGLDVYLADGTFTDIKITRPRPTLPTAEGSVIVGKNKVGNEATFVLDSQEIWHHPHGLIHTLSDALHYTVIYDAGHRLSSTKGN